MSRWDGLRHLEARLAPAPWHAVQSDGTDTPAAFCAKMLAKRSGEPQANELHGIESPNLVDPENGHWVMPAITGNGPMSAQHARDLADLRNMLPDLVATLSRLYLMAHMWEDDGEAEPLLGYAGKRLRGILNGEN